jgi:cholesterol transport system auxiliary component
MSVRNGRFLGGALLLLTLSACALAGLSSPPKLYTLTPKNTFIDNLPFVDAQILIEPPVAAAGIDTARIALNNSPTRLDYFADVSWTDRAPAMIQTLMVESFENSGKIISVGRDTIGLRADFVLKSELREFQAEYLDPREGAAPRVRVRINAKLVTMPRRTIESSKTFEAVEQSRSNGFDDIVDAYDDALGKVLRRLVEWSLSEAYRYGTRRGT